MKILGGYLEKAETYEWDSRERYPMTKLSSTCLTERRLTGKWQWNEPKAL